MQISHWLQRSTKTYTQITVLSIKGLIKKKKKKKKKISRCSVTIHINLGCIDNHGSIWHGGVCQLMAI